MKKIGFIDYYLSEWHANNYPAWIRELNRGYEIAYAWGEEEISPVDGRSSGEWCKEFGVTLCKTAEEVCEKSDVIVILAPSDPQVHLRLAERVLPFGKPTYIDKTFAPDVATAEKIFALAQRYQTPMFSTSALRYAAETDGDYSRVLTQGGGRSAEEYIIHQAEMIVKMLGTGAESVTAFPLAGAVAFRIGYGNGRQGGMLYASSLPFTLTVQKDGEKERTVPVKSAFFPALMAEILTFFDTGIPPVSKDETLEVMALRQTALRALGAPGTKIKI